MPFKISRPSRFDTVMSRQLEKNRFFVRVNQYENRGVVLDFEAYLFIIYIHTLYVPIENPQEAAPEAILSGKIFSELVADTGMKKTTPTKQDRPRDRSSRSRFPTTL